ncbi:cysteine desulfurase [Salinibacterium sp. dk2585]|uniref:cysteine desulfurase family protein n=1 Tax=unclassified Salinibacterium TaxID=2632331 RepID=UPI0011C25791|nr:MULTISPECIES: cysteine desulfurase family protein [unclassified Salinibacterium]QEE61568.1 cysteine desulfurase [Salinibacterium sp. dk2585]TXK52463.1 cysteine desulfurase [Salinibacterium sp. dk5596]
MPVYLDHAATTPMLPAVRDAYVAALDLVGNPASIHSHGQNAKRMLEEAREQVAASLGCDPIEVVFTSGGTEAVNLGIKGLFWARNGAGASRPRILVPRGEHHATIDTVEWLAAHEGAVVDWLPVDDVGRIDVAAVDSALRKHDDIALLTFLWANNEVGTIQPVEELAALAAAHGVPVHVDAVSAYGHLPVSLRDSGASAISISAHKIGGPLGIGALALSRSATLEPLLHGGGQQRNVRSGTQDAPAAIAFGVAAQHPLSSLEPLRDRLIEGVLASVEGAVLRGDPVGRLDNNAHFTFEGCQGDSLLFMLDMAGISASTGSACQAGIPEPSHVLLGMGLTEADARSALRFSLGHDSSEADVDALLAALPAAVERARRAGFSDRAV